MATYRDYQWTLLDYSGEVCGAIDADSAVSAVREWNAAMALEDPDAPRWTRAVAARRNR